MSTLRIYAESKDQTRLPLMLVVAALLHGLLIAGLGFEFELTRNQSDPSPTLEVILVHHSTAEAPENAESLAQVNQDGGGEQEADTRPKSPNSSAERVPETGSGPATRLAAAPKPQPRPRSNPTVISTHAQATKSAAAPREKTREVTLRDLPDARELVAQSLKLARLSAEIDASVETSGQAPRHKYISARTRSYRYALYMEAWRSKVEQIGDLNYPVDRKGRRLAGDLRLDVAINADGSVRGMKLMRSSGRKMLDRAAMNIVELAAPFAPLPEDIRAETDVLHIVRTWQFHNDRGLLQK